MSSRDALFERIFNQQPKGPKHKAEKLSEEERERIKKHKLKTIIGNASNKHFYESEGRSS